jgi:hypothetical protein
MRVRVLANLSRMGPDEFWRTMEANGWVYLLDENYQPISPEQWPDSLGLENFRNDDYRGLVYFTRDIAYQQTPENANYQEFYWGAWLLNHPDFHLSDYDLSERTSYLAAVQRAAQLMSSLSDSDEVVPGITAGQLGRINFNNSEFSKLSKTYCDSKPGKVAYALYYYHNLLGVPPLVTCQ